MIKIYIFADSYKHFEEAIVEYVKRLWKKCEIVKMRPTKKWTDSQIIESETFEIITKLEKEKWYKIVLSPRWKSLNTSKFYDLVEQKKHSFSDIVFCIGWALWFDYDKLKSSIDFELNLWEMTMPHSLALLVILEQIYRLEMIKKGTAYDK